MRDNDNVSLYDLINFLFIFLFEQPIDREFEKFSIFHTLNGSSEESKFIGDLKIKKDS